MVGEKTLYVVANVDNLVPRGFPLKVGWTPLLPSREKPWDRS